MKPFVARGGEESNKDSIFAGQAVKKSLLRSRREVEASRRAVSCDEFDVTTLTHADDRQAVSRLNETLLCVRRWVEWKRKMFVTRISMSMNRLDGRLLRD
jgi:hypothetical protein